MYNLTVQELHTYYVMAGDIPVLVHNSCGNAEHADECYCNWGEPVVPRDKAAGAAAASESEAVWDAAARGEVPDETVGADGFTRHAVQRLQQRGVSEEDAQAVLERTPFSYRHDDQYKIGYYDPDSKIFVAKTVDGNINTVMTNVDQAYINRLREAK